MAKAVKSTLSGRLGRAAVVAAVLLFYAPLLGRDFTSEDYLLLRQALEHPPWRDLGALLTGPWLGIEVVRFYRPLAQVLLAAEARAFGGEPLSYNLVHLLVHAVSSLLVYRLAAGLLASRAAGPATSGAPAAAPAAAAGDPRAAGPAALAALLFALHPLHPNAVSFIASYATLFAGIALFGSAVAWEAWRAGEPGVTAEGGRRARRRAGGRYAAALFLYAAAVGCYEAAVVLPLALLLRELLVPDAGAAGAARLRRTVATLPYFAVAGLYLLLRSAIFGQVLAGYEATAQRLSLAAWQRLAEDALVALQRLFLPAFDPPRPEWAPLTVLALAAALPILLAVLRPPSWRRELGVWLLAWAWMALFLAPFAFQPPVPANGRFAYLAAVGTALALGRLAATAWAGRRATAGKVVASWLALALILAIGLFWAVELAGAVGDMRRAGETARRVREELAAAAAAAPAGPLFVAGHPRFLFNEAGVPLAQVLRYGLADSVEPPFAATGVPRAKVYPLPEGLTHGARAAFGAAPGTTRPRPRFLVWDGEAGIFRRQPGRVARRVAHIAVAEAGAEPTRGPWEVSFLPVPGAARHRLVVLARGNPAELELAPAAGPAGVAVAQVPEEFVRSMRRLYSGPSFGGPIFWWIEARDAQGALLAVSPAREWPQET